MLVANKTLHPHTIVTSYTDAKNQTGITMHRNEFTLFPGVNEVAAEQWEEAKKLNSINLQIDEGDFVEQGINPITARTVDNAKTLIKQTYNKELLEKWLVEDTRDSVKSAVSQQLKSITLTDDEKKKARGE